MTQSLRTGASGLLAHQHMLDVVSNNIANLNTTGFKSQQTLFSDLVYNDLGAGSGPSGTNFGGINPREVGNGVQIASISQNFSQGIFTDTGSEFDFALDGNGFFVLSGDDSVRYTRDGSFAVNALGRLIDPATGLHVQRFGDVGEATGSGPAFQVAGDSRINVPLGASVPGQETSTAELIGNLPASAEPAFAEILTSAIPLTASGVPATTATLLNDLDLNSVDYILGDSLDIVGTDVDGSSYSTSLALTPATTLGDLVNDINANLVDAQVTVAADGNLVLTANDPGEALLSLTIADDPANTGQSDFATAAMVIETDGKDADVVQTTIQVFDSRGESHTLHVSLEKQDFNTWNATFDPADGSLTMTDNQISGITFDEDGSFLTVAGTGDGDSDIELSINSLTGTQQIQFGLDRLTHLATGFTATYEQDGFSPGTIVAMEVSGDGILSGIASNGRRLEVAQLAVARFNNVHGLEHTGENYYEETGASGTPSVGAGSRDGRGVVRGGQLEDSNVNVTLEFAQLIVAQRGFSANARTITIASEILQELNNII